MATSVSRPRTIQELASLATTETYDPSRSLKDSLRAADALRQQGKLSLQNGDLEAAFVNTARAVTIIVEKIPRHPDYLRLTSQQKQNLAFVSCSTYAQAPLHPDCSDRLSLEFSSPLPRLLVG